MSLHTNAYAKEAHSFGQRLSRPSVKEPKRLQTVWCALSAYGYDHQLIGRAV